MSNVDQATWPDEKPTKKSESFPSKVLVLASRIDRLAELAIERLQIAPDADAVAAALGDLVQIRELAAGVIQ